MIYWGCEDWCNFVDCLVMMVMSYVILGYGWIVMLGELGGLGFDIDGFEELVLWWVGGVVVGVD